MKNKHKFKAIIFDMDGVIVDSMPYHYISWYEALKPYGVTVTAIDMYEREGEMWQKTLVDLLGREGIKPDKLLLLKLIETKKKLFKKYFKRYIFKGAEDFLRCMKNKQYLLALVTGTPEKEVKTILSKNMLKLFDAIICGDQVKQGKPHPEPYLSAAKRLKVLPKECAVVENAPFGIESAKKAGMFCFAITTSLPAVFLKKADIVVNKLEEIIPEIERSC